MPKSAEFIRRDEQGRDMWKCPKCGSTYLEHPSARGLLKPCTHCKINLLLNPKGGAGKTP